MLRRALVTVSSLERGAGCPFQLRPDSHWHTVLLGELEMGQGDPCGLSTVPGLQEEGKAGRYVLADTFSLSLCRKRAKTTLDWRGMRSPPCWKTLCLQRSKSSSSKSAAKPKLNGERAPAKLAAQHVWRKSCQSFGGSTPAEPGAGAMDIP